MALFRDSRWAATWLRHARRQPRCPGWRRPEIGNSDAVRGRAACRRRGRINPETTASGQQSSKAPCAGGARFDPGWLHQHGPLQVGWVPSLRLLEPRQTQPDDWASRLGIKDPGRAQSRKLLAHGPLATRETWFDMAANRALPNGRLPDGTVCYGFIGELGYDPEEDKVQCHLCAEWLHQVGGSHLPRKHGWTIEEYRQAFRIPKRIATCGRGDVALAAAGSPRTARQHRRTGLGPRRHRSGLCASRRDRTGRATASQTTTEQEIAILSP